jgi:hypothetical protein
VPALRATTAGESPLWVDPAEIPASADIDALGHALAQGLHGDRDELMANTAAYTGLRWGELTALTITQVDQAARVITVDRKIADIAGYLYLEPPRTARTARPSTPARPPPATPSPNASPPGSSRPAPSKPPEPTRTA